MSIPIPNDYYNLDNAYKNRAFFAVTGIKNYFPSFTVAPPNEETGIRDLYNPYMSIPTENQREEYRNCGCGVSNCRCGLGLGLGRGCGCGVSNCRCGLGCGRKCENPNTPLREGYFANTNKYRCDYCNPSYRTLSTYYHDPCTIKCINGCSK